MRALTLSVVTALLAGCGGSQTDAAAPLTLAVPDRANAHVTLAAEGERVAAAWAATGPGGTDIYLAVSGDGGRRFGDPTRVNDVEGDARVNGEQPPQVVLRGADVSVIWTARREGSTALRAAVSADGGATFSAARTISPRSTGARGWESAAVAGDGTLHAVWLDGRNAAPSRVPHSTAPRGSPATLHGRTFITRRGVAWRRRSKPQSPPTCASAAKPPWPPVARMCMSRGDTCSRAASGTSRSCARATADGRSPEPVRVSADDWKIDACPDDGPSMAIDDRGVLHLVWPTLVDDGGGPRLGIFEAVSRDGGRTFTPRARVDGGQAAPAHPRVAGPAGGRMARVWDELASGSRRVMYRAGPAAAIALSRGRAASYPAVAASGDGFVIAWTEQSDSRSIIQVARAR